MATEHQLIMQSIPAVAARETKSDEKSSNHRHCSMVRDNLGSPTISSSMPIKLTKKRNAKATADTTRAKCSKTAANHSNDDTALDRDDTNIIASSSSIHPMQSDRYNLRPRYEKDVMYVALDTSAAQVFFRLNDDDEAKPVWFRVRTAVC